jgi:hypothetical protein
VRIARNEEIEKMDEERRLRDVIRRAEPTDGRKFVQWFGRHFVTLTNSHATLYYSADSDSRSGAVICKVRRDADGYAALADHLFG